MFGPVTHHGGGFEECFPPFRSLFLGLDSGPRAPPTSSCSVAGQNVCSVTAHICAHWCVVSVCTVKSTHTCRVVCCLQEVYTYSVH
eukprot:Pgem_evm1s8991